MSGWAWALAFLCLFPSLAGVFNPFLAPVARYIQERMLSKALWTAYCSGLFLDLLLPSPCLGVLGFSSLMSAAAVYQLFTIFDLEIGTTRVAVLPLAAIEFCTNLLCVSLFGKTRPFEALWSWEAFLLFVALSGAWGLGLGPLGSLCKKALTRYWSSKS